jgi:hypothetical protein
MTRDGLTYIERARNIGGEQLLPLLDGKVLERRTELHAGIIDQDIDRPGISLDRLDTVLGGLGERHIEAGHRYLVPDGRQSRRCKIKLGCVAAVQDDFGAVFGKAVREREPDPLRRAGDERPLIRQVEKFKCHMTIPCWLRGKSSAPERLLDAVQSKAQEGIGMNVEELHAFFEPIWQLIGRHQRTGDLAPSIAASTTGRSLARIFEYRGRNPSCRPRTHAGKRSAKMVDLLKTVNRCWNAFHSRLQLERQELRVVA